MSGHNGDTVNADPFSDEAVAAICRHMNDDHTADTLVICRAFGAWESVDAARLESLGPNGLEFTVDSGGAQHTLSLPWLDEVTDRAQVRAEIVARFHEAQVRLGENPTTH